MKDVIISNSVKYIGCSDRTLDLFEGQYILPDGMAYNSYLILDEKTCVMDTVDGLVKNQFLENLENALGARTLDYLVVQHLEPDHSASIAAVCKKHPEAKLVLSAKAAAMLSNFFPEGIENEIITVKEGDKLSLGSHTLSFVAAPMVHWPEVIVSYEESEKLLFAADAFGKFGAMDCEDDDWACEARRYYFNIVGKYGAQVQSLLKKLSGIEVLKILPLHGPILTENLSYYIGLYDTWSSYKPEKEGVFIAFATLHGHTKEVALELKALLDEKGVKTSIADLSRADIAECVEDAFKYSKIVLAASSYDAGVMPKMEELLAHLKAKNFQNRTVALVENTSWAPSAIRTMKASLDSMKNITVLEPTVSVKVNLTDETRKALCTLADELAK